MRRSSVGVSKLADYAVDPSDYCKRRGGARSAKAVKYGNHHHNRVIRFSSFRQKFITVIVVAAIGYFLVSYAGWL